MFFSISAFFFFYFASIGVYIIFLPQILSTIGYSSFEIGVLFAIAPLIRFLTPFIFLKHIQLTRTFFRFALLATLLGALMLNFTLFHFFALFFNLLFVSFFWGLLLPYSESIALKSIQKVYGKSRLWGSFGFLLTGIILAKYLTSYHIGIISYVIFVSFTLFFGYMISKSDEVTNTTNTSLQTIKHTFELKTLQWFWISGALLQFSFAPFYNFFTIYETSYGHSLEVVSYLWAVGVIFEVLMFHFQSPLFHFNLLRLMQISLFLTIFRWMILYLFPESLLMTFASQSIHAFSFALHHSAALLYISSIYPQNKIASQFYYGLSWGLGGLLGSIFSGFFYGEHIFFYSALFATLSLFMLQLEYKQYTMRKIF